MDLDKALISAILSEGSESLERALARGISVDRLRGEGQEAFRFVLEYYQQYKSLPVLAQLEGKTGIDLNGDLFILEDTPPKSADWWVNEVNNRHLHTKIQQGLKDVQKLQEERKPLEAFSLLEKVTVEIREQQVGIASVESLFAAGREVRDFYNAIKSGKRGIETRWPTVNDATLGFWPEDLVLFVARVATGKCVFEGTELYDPQTGVPHTIREICESPNIRRITTWSKSNGIHATNITAKIDSGRKNCWRIRLATGREIVVTPEHPFLTPEGWKRADSLGVGKAIGLPQRMPFPEEPVELPKAELDILAVLLAEGSTTGHHIGFTTTDPEILNICTEGAERLEARVVQYDAQKPSYDFVGCAFGKNRVLDLTRREGVWRKLAKEKTLPHSIFRLPEAQLARFLSVFWMCDGYVDDSPGITLASKKMVFQLQSLLLRFGIQSSVKYKAATLNGKVFDSWHLRVFSRSIPVFLDKIPLWGSKLVALRNLAAAAPKRTSVGQDPVVSEQFVEQLRKQFVPVTGRWGPQALKTTGRALKRTNFGFRDLFGDARSVSSGKGRPQREQSDRALMLSSFREFCQQLGTSALVEYQWLWESDLFWDVIEQIEEVGEQKIYDLTVVPTACFVANDIVVHNSWTAVITALDAWWNEEAKARTGKRVLFITTEMSKLRIRMRFLAVKERLNYNEFTHGRLSFLAEERFYRALDELERSDGLFIIGGDFDFQIESVASAIETCKPDLVVVDGVYLLRVAGATRNERMANAFDEMKRLAKRKKIPVVITTQLNREAKKEGGAKTLQVENIALSDVGAWNADLIIGLNQTEEMKADRRLEFKPLKVREGEGKSILLNWNFERMDFSEVNTNGGGGGDGDEAGLSTAPEDTSPADDFEIPF